MQARARWYWVAWHAREHMRCRCERRERRPMSSNTGLVLRSHDPGDFTSSVNATVDLDILWHLFRYVQAPEDARFSGLI
jgi:hypothetical protein